MLKNFTGLYNSDQKLRFLKEEYPNELTRKTYGSLLLQLTKFEEFYKKDLCDFSYSEAVDSLIGLRKKTFKSLDVAQTIIVKYINWCMNEGYSSTGINSFKLLNKEDLQKLVHQIAQKESYFTREEIFEMVVDIVNPIDKALIILLFEGVRGRTEFEELRNLKNSDIFISSNTLLLTRDNGDQRVISVEDRSIEILMNAMEQEYYHKGNGEGTGVFATPKLRETDYLLRASDNGKNMNIDERMAVPSINTRFRAFRSFTGISFLNPTLVFQSGLLEKCSIIENESGNIEPENYRQIYRDMNLDDKNWYNLKTMYEMYKKNIASV
ncbi:MAG TPA: hypothetical protein GX523_20125 [Desulfitobacterium dehalogenans]|uniref:Uncharacterized protein n=1 Tax=Desulfitobacterium dehalogenans TaxID=36854 RepID=A0A7C6Z7A8_9FIRM|nr:hypothetical protein [Desulfitobacterium dehalogenans]